jgi:hypothetical protein
MNGRFTALNFQSKDASRTGPQLDDLSRVAYRWQPSDTSSRAIHGTIAVDRLPPHAKLSNLVGVDLRAELDETGAITAVVYAAQPKRDLDRRTRATKLPPR